MLGSTECGVLCPWRVLIEKSLHRRRPVSDPCSSRNRPSSKRPVGCPKSFTMDAWRGGISGVIGGKGSGRSRSRSWIGLSWKQFELKRRLLACCRFRSVRKLCYWASFIGLSPGSTVNAWPGGFGHFSFSGRLDHGRSASYLLMATLAPGRNADVSGKGRVLRGEVVHGQQAGASP